MSGPISVADLPPIEIEDESVDHPTLERFPSRSTTVGGIPVRRALPKREHRTIGAWCFVDHFGPASPSQAAMEIGPHPHIGLHTVTWLLEGEVVHHDSLGSEQVIRPGQLNLMTAGRGVAHAEESTGRAPGLHGVQIWVAQPDRTRNGEPAFAHHDELPVIGFGKSQATVLVGDLDGHRSPARADTPLAGYVVEIGDHRPMTIPLRTDFEYGLVVLRGSAAIGDQVVGPGELAYLGTNNEDLRLRGTDDTELLVLGGEPFEEEVLMWWNFVARHRDEVDAARLEWEAESPRFGTVRSDLQRTPSPAPAWEPRR